MRAALVAVAIGAVALGLAAPARADDMSYIRALTDNGITVYNVDLALHTGHSICTALDTTNGAVVANNLYKQATWGDVPNMNVANTIVVLAAQELCPWNDHTGHLTPSTPDNKTTGRFA